MINEDGINWILLVPTGTGPHLKSNFFFSFIRENWCSLKVYLFQKN